MSTTTARMTVDEFLKLPEVECGKLELIDGEIFPLEYAGFVHARVKSNLNEILVVWLSQQRIGRVFIETTYQLDDSEAVAPDLSVLRNERLAPATKDLPQGAPDLAIEVVSSELAERLQTKIRLYFEHGSKVVWVVYPNQRTIQIYDSKGHAITLGEDRVLEARDVLPGFSTPVGAIFEGV